MDNNKDMPSEHWKEDCLKWQGEVLTGKYAHWCPEWDELPIDETCSEFESCTCYSADLIHTTKGE